MAHGQQFGKVSSLLCCVCSCVHTRRCVFIPSGRICPSAPARCLLQRGPGALSSRAVREVSFVFCETLSCRSFVSLRVLLVDVFSLVVFVFRPTHRAVRALPPFFRLSRSRIFSGLPARSLRCVIKPNCRSSQIYPNVFSTTGERIISTFPVVVSISSATNLLIVPTVPIFLPTLHRSAGIPFVWLPLSVVPAQPFLFALRN